MGTTPRSRIRLAAYPAFLGWLLLFLAAHRPDSGSSWSYAHAGLTVGGGFTLLTALAAAAALLASREDGAYAAAWLGGIAGAIFFDCLAFAFDRPLFDGLLELGPAPDPQRDAVGHVVSLAGWIGLLTALLAVAALVVSRRGNDPRNAKSRPEGG